MGLRLIYGRAGTGKSEKCYKEISEKIKQNNKILIITPEQFSFTAEKKLMEAIETEAVFNAEVVTFSRMAYRVIQEIGGRTETNLSKCGKAMLIYSILNNCKYISSVINGTNGAAILHSVVNTLYNVTYAPIFSSLKSLPQYLSLFLRTYQFESSSVKFSIVSAAAVISYLSNFSSTSFTNVFNSEIIHLSITFVNLKSAYSNGLNLSISAYKT